MKTLTQVFQEQGVIPAQILEMKMIKTWIDRKKVLFERRHKKIYFPRYKERRKPGSEQRYFLKISNKLFSEWAEKYAALFRKHYEKAVENSVSQKFHAKCVKNSDKRSIRLARWER